MLILDLFSGTGSVCKEANRLGWNVVSVDICDKYSTPTFKTNIMDWNYKIFNPGAFDVIFAGVPCEAYSSLQAINKTPERREADICESNKVVRRTLEIINHLKPKVWFIENPDGGRLKDQLFMRGLPFYVVSYCKYGFPYRKNTRIWTNLKGFQPKRCRNDCEQRGEDGRHLYAIGSSSKNCGEFQKRLFKLNEKYAYPPQLIRELLLQSEHDNVDKFGGQ